MMLVMVLFQALIHGFVMMPSAVLDTLLTKQENAASLAFSCAKTNQATA